MPLMPYGDSNDLKLRFLEGFGKLDKTLPNKHIS